MVSALCGPDPQGAARALYRTYGPELYGFAVRRLRDEGLAEELVQDVFTRAWSSAARYRPQEGSVRTWLYAIARNAVIDAERRRGVRPPRRAGGRTRTSLTQPNRSRGPCGAIRYSLRSPV
jgi:RNA polymerase sigma-70 factor (ECF subfamily)